jgi:hypothetical protein
MKQIREDLLDAYIFLQTKLNAALVSKGSSAKIDATRMSCMGWSAGATGTIFLTHDILAYNAAAEQDCRLQPLKAVVCTYINSDSNMTFTEPIGAIEKLKEDNPEDWQIIQDVLKENVSTEARVQ